MSAVIEKARSADIPILVDLMAEFYAESNYALDREWAADSFAQLVQAPDRGAAWIGRDASQVAGYVVLTMKHSMEFGGPDAFIDDLFVRPNSRRRGVATLLLHALFEECRERNALAVHAGVGHDNEGAIALYQAFGLRADGRKHLTAHLDREPLEGAALGRHSRVREGPLIDRLDWAPHIPHHIRRKQWPP